MSRTKKQSSLEIIKERVEDMNFSSTVNKSTKRLNIEKLKKLAEDVRRTFVNEDFNGCQLQS